MKQTLLPLLAACAMCACTATPEASDYAVVAGPGIADDPQWNSVIEALCESHPGARVIHYRDTVSEALPALREAAPRYVAFVEQPEQVGRAYIIALNRMSREVDDDIYADYLWGVITGYDAEAALRMVRDAREPLVIRSAVSTLREVGSGKWFDSFAYVDDRNAGICGEKKPGADSVSHYRTERLLEDGRPDLLRSFCDFYAAYDPDLITTASHATERNLEMPFSVGNLRARDGALYADFPEGPEALKESGKRRVFLPIGNCLIGNVNNTRESMAIAWMNSAHASAMAGYVVPTWYGRNGWGGLKYWLTTPGATRSQRPSTSTSRTCCTRSTRGTPNCAASRSPTVPMVLPRRIWRRPPKWPDVNLRSMSWAFSSTATCWPSTATRHGTSG